MAIVVTSAPRIIREPMIALEKSMVVAIAIGAA